MTAVISSPATYSALLGGAPNHTLAVEVHFTPLLVELGARGAVLRTTRSSARGL